MKQHITTLYVLCLLCALCVPAQAQWIRVWQNGESTRYAISDASTIPYSTAGSTLTIDGDTYSTAAIDSITIVNPVTIRWSGATASVDIPELAPAGDPPGDPVRLCAAQRRQTQAVFLNNKRAGRKPALLFFQSFYQFLIALHGQGLIVGIDHLARQRAGWFAYVTHHGIIHRKLSAVSALGIVCGDCCRL